MQNPISTAGLTAVWPVEWYFYKVSMLNLRSSVLEEGLPAQEWDYDRWLSPVEPQPCFRTSGHSCPPFLGHLSAPLRDILVLMLPQLEGCCTPGGCFGAWNRGNILSSIGSLWKPQRPVNFSGAEKFLWVISFLIPLSPPSPGHQHQ